MKSGPSDKQAQFGPSDQPVHFEESSLLTCKRTSDSSKNTPVPKKKAVSRGNSVIQVIPIPHPEVMGKVRLRFNVLDVCELQWFRGIITTYNGMTQKYGVYFPADEQTADVSLDSEDDLQFLD